MANPTGHYEIIMVFSVANGSEAVQALSDKFTTLIKNNGTIDSTEEWGNRRLAYPINDEIEGYYLLVNFTSKPDFPAELDRVLKITDGVLRSLIVTKSDKVEAPAQAEAAPEAPSAEYVKERIRYVQQSDPYRSADRRS